MTAYHIDFEPVGRRGPCLAGQSLLDGARQLGVGLVSICDGKGTCGHCKVQVLGGLVTLPSAVEHKMLSPCELAEGYRLACQTYPLADCKLRVPAESLTTPQRTQVEGLEANFHLEPVVSAYAVRMPPPSLSDLRADAERLAAAVEQEHQIRCHTIDVEVLRDLSPRLRSWDWQAQAAVRDGEVVALGQWPRRQLGLAVDLGTTKIAGYLVDLQSGQTVAAQGAMNPQIAYGEDVISRIARTKGSPREAERLQTLAVEALNGLAADLCATVDAAPDEIVEAVVVGNTAMHHLFLRLPVEQLALSPYVPAVRQALDIKARDAGLRIAPGAYVHLLPNVAGFVGADHVAMLLATGAHREEGTTLALDIGTNTEVCLISNGEMVSASCASGPAFEGAHIKHGMRAASGAIEHLRLVDDQVEYQTIGGVPPVGLCGSGILDALAQLYLCGAVDCRGKLGEHSRIRTSDGQREFVLVDEEGCSGHAAIVITQRDVRELQLAKGAIRAGIQILLEAKGRVEQEIDRVIIAGAFGSYVDVASAITVGMVPALPLARFSQVGNASGTGAKMALVSRASRQQAQTLARSISYVELAAAPRFMDIFSQAMYLGEYELQRG